MATQYKKPNVETEDDLEHTTPGGDSAQSKEETHLIYLKDPIGRKFQFPFKVAKTWHVSLSYIHPPWANNTDTTREWKA